MLGLCVRQQMRQAGDQQTPPTRAEFRGFGGFPGVQEQRLGGPMALRGRETTLSRIRSTEYLVMRMGDGTKLGSQRRPRSSPTLDMHVCQIASHCRIAALSSSIQKNAPYTSRTKTFVLRMARQNSTRLDRGVCRSDFALRTVVNRRTTEQCRVPR